MTGQGRPEEQIRYPARGGACPEARAQLHAIPPSLHRCLWQILRVLLRACPASGNFAALRPSPERRH